MADGAKSGLASGTSGSPQLTLDNDELAAKAKDNESTISQESKRQPIFSKTGHVTLDSISARREFFLGKSVSKIEKELHKHGYQTRVRGSIHANSKARIIVVTNSTKERNISQVQVSPKSKRHGDVPYVKISTTDYGRIKIIGTDPEHYKTDNKEKAKLLFRRKRR
ncbi:MAG: hypothetical protein K5979_05560 [Ruminococcus sp.]|nr:hypothetical protein [Ruminococcus sp.]